MLLSISVYLILAFSLYMLATQIIMEERYALKITKRNVSNLRYRM